ncbi:uracil-DNA glycosylase [Alcaligenaceae bacterium CGII-47]|nr:uracil-DNA glycosylase [Alcaligenaceae bacterium CGII-47]
MSLCVTPLQEAWLTEIGVDAQWLARFRAAPARVAPQPASPDVLVTDAVPDRLTEPDHPDLATLHARILVCEACPLHTGRTHAVPGAGETQAPDLLIVGEMPGVDDDMSGLPFQGTAGDLLRAMLASAGLAQKTVFMSTVIKCRPSGGRAAHPTEVASCLPYLRQQIELLHPQHILALGHLAAQAVLGTDKSLSALRGQMHHYQTLEGQSIPVWVTHHPASLLLRPGHKAEAWRDLLQLATYGAALAGPLSS